MSYDKILKYRQNSPAECRIQFADTGCYFGRSCRSIDSTIWIVSPTGLPISSRSFTNRCAGLDYFTLYPDHNQNADGCREAASVICTNQWHDDWRDCGACHSQFSRQAAPPWLIAIGEVMTLSWNMLLIVCMPLNWSKCLLFWFRTGNAALMNLLD